MADDVIIGGNIYIEISKSGVHDIIPYAELADFTDQIFELPDDVMLSQVERIQEQIQSLNDLRMAAVRLEQDGCVPYLLGEYDPMAEQQAEQLHHQVRQLLANKRNTFSYHSQMILELLSAFLDGYSGEGDTFIALRKCIRRWKTNLINKRKELE